MRINKLWSMMMLAVLTLPMMVACGGDDDDNGNNSAIAEYAGSWNCTSPATYQKNTIVTEGTNLLITSSGGMTWTMPDGTKYSATMRALGDDWADITYNGKTYRTEIYVNGKSLTINANGNADLKVKDFPFDGRYERTN